MNPTSAWVAQQIREAFSWDSAPRYIIHDNDPLFQGDCRKLTIVIGIEPVKTAKASPWQNARCERMVGSLHWELFSCVIVFNESHLRRLMVEYLDYYHNFRTHLGLDMDTPIPRAVQLVQSGQIVSSPVLGGLHHQYLRISA
jgi:putative transposase